MSGLPKYKFKTYDELMNGRNKNEEEKKLSLNNFNQTTSHSTKPKLSTNGNVLTEHESGEIKKAKSTASLKESRSASKSHFSNLTCPDDYQKKVEKVEKLIGIVKEHAFDRNRLVAKKQKIDKLQNTVDIINTYIKLNRIQRRNFASMNKGVEKENERLANASEVYFIF